MPVIAIATSTRADWGLLRPIARALSLREGVDVRVVATNMHLNPRFGMTVGEIEKVIWGAGAEILTGIKLFDIYRGAQVGPGKKSVAFSLELRADDRTLTDEDTTGVMNAVLEKLKNDLGVSLR